MSRSLSCWSTLGAGFCLVIATVSGEPLWLALGMLFVADAFRAMEARR